MGAFLHHVADFGLPIWVIFVTWRIRRLERIAPASVDLRPAIRDEVTAQLAKRLIAAPDPRIVIEAIRADAEVAKEMLKTMGRSFGP